LGVLHEANGRSGQTNEPPLAMVRVRRRSKVLPEHRDHAAYSVGVIVFLERLDERLDFERCVLAFVVRAVTEAVFNAMILWCACVRV
jgi:hypothetical protein